MLYATKKVFVAFNSTIGHWDKQCRLNNYQLLIILFAYKRK